MLSCAGLCYAVRCRAVLCCAVLYYALPFHARWHHILQHLPCDPAIRVILSRPMILYLSQLDFDSTHGRQTGGLQLMLHSKLYVLCAIVPLCAAPQSPPLSNPQALPLPSTPFTICSASTFLLFPSPTFRLLQDPSASLLPKASSVPLESPHHAPKPGMSL